MNQDTFYVNINGKPSRKHALWRTLRYLGRVFMAETHKLLSDITNDLTLAYFDYVEGTHLYAELQAKRKQERIQAQRRMYGL